MVCELIVTTPPQGNGPMFGRPCSSRARFHAVMERHQLFSTPPKHREVYHDKDTCPDGKRIKPEHRESGTGGKKHCLECYKVS